jgi:hypothetical protein
MSRTIILSLAAAATIAAASLASGAADARGFGGGGMGGGRSFGGGGHFSNAGHMTTSRSVGHNRLATNNTGRGGHPGHPGKPGRPGHFAHHHHHHWIFRDGIWVDFDDGYGYGDVIGEPVVATPGPCTCLTKTYTQDGLVVFADVCTKEAASARIDGGAADVTPLPPAGRKASNATPVSPADSKAADASQQPTSTNYAGRTYQDFLAATQSAQKN